MKVADLYRETAISITAKGLDIFAEMLVDPAAFADFVKSPAAVRTLQAVIAAGDRGKSLAAQALAAPDAVRLLADDGHWATAQPSIPVGAGEQLVVGRFYANKKGIFGGVWENPKNRDGDVVWSHSDDYRLSCRPCRVELAL